MYCLEDTPGDGTFCRKTDVASRPGIIRRSVSAGVLSGAASCSSTSLFRASSIIGPGSRLREGLPEGIASAASDTASIRRRATERSICAAESSPEPCYRDTPCEGSHSTESSIAIVVPV